MTSNDDGAEAQAGPPAVSPRRKLLDTIIWVVIPIAFAIVLAVKYWPR